MNKTFKLDPSTEELSHENKSKGSRILNLVEVLNLNILMSPDSKKSLTLDKIITKENLSIVPNKAYRLTDGENYYQVSRNGQPVLQPISIGQYFESEIPLLKRGESPWHYFILNQIKNSSSESNSPLDSIPAKRHRWRMKKFLELLPSNEKRGVLLDIGSDRPSSSSLLFPENYNYIGLDPRADSSEFSIIGFAELLPFKNQFFDCAVFNTSLDHILDYNLAIAEAFRILRNKGSVVISTYAWLKNADLLNDTMHFHHFREFEILGALEGMFKVTNIKRYEDPKGDNHRYGLYVMAEKLG